MIDAATFWDRAAAKYARDPIRDMEAYTHTMDRTYAHLTPDMTGLEIGCGTGATALLLAPHLRHLDATDIAPNMIAIARQRATGADATNLRFTVCDLFKAGEDAAPYDVVFAHNLLHLVEDIPAALAHVHGLLKPGGLFISKTVCRPQGALPFKMRLMFLAIPLLQKLGKAPAVNLMPQDDYDAALRHAGFEILEAENRPVAPPCRYVVARRAKD